MKMNLKSRANFLTNRRKFIKKQLAKKNYEQQNFIQYISVDSLLALSHRLNKDVLRVIGSYLDRPHIRKKTVEELHAYSCECLHTVKRIEPQIIREKLECHSIPCDKYCRFNKYDQSAYRMIKLLSDINFSSDYQKLHDQIMYKYDLWNYARNIENVHRVQEKKLFNKYIQESQKHRNKKWNMKYKNKKTMYKIEKKCESLQKEYKALKKQNDLKFYNPYK